MKNLNRSLLLGVIASASVLTASTALAKLRMESGPGVSQACFVGRVSSVTVHQSNPAQHAKVTVRIASGSSYRDVIFVGETSMGAVGLSAAIGKAARACEPGTLQVF